MAMCEECFHKNVCSKYEPKSYSACSNYISRNNSDAFEEGYRRGRAECYKEIEYWRDMTLFWEGRYNALIGSLSVFPEPKVTLLCDNVPEYIMKYFENHKTLNLNEVLSK